MQERVRVPNQEYYTFDCKHASAKDVALGDINRDCSGFDTICIYYKSSDGKTWRKDYNLVTMMTQEIDRQYDRYKGQYESYTKLHGLSIVLSGRDYLSTRNKYLTSLRVASGSMNHVSEFELDDFDYLKEVIIEDNCYTSATRFKVDGLSSLEKLVVGKKSFTNGNYEKYYSSNRSFVVRNCPMLTLIDIGDCSFAEWGGEWELSGLDRLERLRIMSEDEGESTNFQASPFVIKGSNTEEL